LASEPYELYRSMLSSANIKNYKSIVNLSLPLGRFNVLIGENGCGKSNILEALTLGAAAEVGPLEKVFLEAKGIRMTSPRFMLPAFEDMDPGSIEISMIDDNGIAYSHILIYEASQKPPYWKDIVQSNTYNLLRLIMQKQSGESRLKVSEVLEQLENFSKDTIFNINIKEVSGEPTILFIQSKNWSQFQTFSLDEYELRSYSQPGETSLGIHGKGLFSYIKEIAQKPEGWKILSEIREGLKLLDWFDDMTIPENQLMNENEVFLKDRYIRETLNTFDQRSTNEGFLYLLFYLTLVISDDTPPFFAIDNIDSSFNPKLCREVIRLLITLAKKHGKQIIATTHNPAVLDGLDLSDDEQKLMVVHRSIDGYTRIRTIKKDEVTESSMPLSQLWMRGFIGGLPVNF